MERQVNIDTPFFDYSLPAKPAGKSRAWLNGTLIAFFVAVVFALDQASKAYVRSTLALGESVPREGVFRFTHTFNTGSAFGLFSNQTNALIVASVLGIIVLIVLYRQQAKPSMFLRLSLGLQLGGAIGNLTDRVLRGHVTDFIDVGWWPVFNLADSAIVIGIAIVAWYLMFPKEEPRPRPALPAPMPIITPAPLIAMAVDGPDLAPKPELRDDTTPIPAPAPGIVLTVSSDTGVQHGSNGTNSMTNGHAPQHEDVVETREAGDTEKWGRPRPNEL